MACQSGEIMCNDGSACYSTKSRCDGNQDCSDGSDEVSCKFLELCLTTAAAAVVTTTTSTFLFVVTITTSTFDLCLNRHRPICLPMLIHLLQLIYIFKPTYTVSASAN